MTPPFRIGLFPYLNVQPLVLGLRTESDFELIIDLPSRIADRFRNGDLDLAMVPSLEAVTLDVPILDSVCIASDGPVETVMLRHRVALDRVRTLALDEASRTSAALAKILIAQASGTMPQCASFSPRSDSLPDTDAFLVIGDPAFTFTANGFADLDLGAAWKIQNSLPFVFAVLAAASPATARATSSRILAAHRRGLAAASTIVRSYTSGIDDARAERYLRSVLRYDLGPREKAGLALFYRLAQANGLLAQVKELQFHAV